MANACLTLSTHFILSIGTCSTTICHKKQHKNVLISHYVEFFSCITFRNTAKIGKIYLQVKISTLTGCMLRPAAP